MAGQMEASQAPKMYAIFSVFFVLPLMAVGLRLLARRVSNMRLWWDDWLILVAAVGTKIPDGKSRTPKRLTESKGAGHCEFCFFMRKRVLRLRPRLVKYFQLTDIYSIEQRRWETHATNSESRPSPKVPDLHICRRDHIRSRHHLGPVLHLVPVLAHLRHQQGFCQDGIRFYRSGFGLGHRHPLDFNL